MNKVILMGRLTRDPDVRYSQGQNQIAIARFTLAVDRRRTAEGQQSADYIPCVALGKNGEFAEKYLKKRHENRSRGKNPDGKLHKQRRAESIHNRGHGRESGVCRK